MPAPAPVDTSKLADLALYTMKRAPFPMLATVDREGMPRVRPISPLRNDVFTVWAASLRSSNKTAEVENNSAVELCYMDEGHDQVRISGRAERIEDRETKLELWDSTPLLRQFLGSVDNPEFVLYRIRPERVRFMREWALEYFEVPFREENTLPDGD